VAGLLTGQDVIKNLKKGPVGQYLVMPRNMFRAGEDVMLDDVRIQDLEAELNTKVLVVDYTGEDLIEKINETLIKN
jgi:NifB/MoaA-like Fe-S oxidoreductase